MSEAGIIILEATTISIVVIFLLLVIGNYIRKKIKGLPTGECACCHKSTKKMLKEYRKAYADKK